MSGLIHSASISTWAAFLTRSFCVFFLPVFLAFQLTPSEVSVWLILVTLQSLQLLTGASAGLSVTRAVAYSLAGASQVSDMRVSDKSKKSEPNHILLARIWGASNAAHIVFGFSGLFLLSGLGLWSISSVVDEQVFEVEALFLLVLFVLGSALRAYGGHHIAYLLGVNRVALLRWWEAAFWLAAFVAAATAIWTGAGLLGVALSYQIPLAANILWNMWLCRRDQAARSGFVRCWRPDRDIIVQLWPSVWRTGLGNFFYLGTTQGAGLYYATIGEPAQVAAFLFAMSLIRPLGQFAQVPFFTQLPVLARLQVSGERGTQRAIAERSMRQSYLLHTGMVLGVALLLPLLAQMHEGGLQVPLQLWLLIGLAGYLERMGGMHLQLYSSTNHMLVHWANGLTALVFLGLAVGLFGWLGVAAFPAAHALALLMIYLPIGMINSYRTYALPIPGFELKTSVLPLVVLLGAITVGM